MKEHPILIALGANLPLESVCPAETLVAAIDRLGTCGLVVRRVSRFFQTPCFPVGHGPDYVNAAAAVGWPDPGGRPDPAKVLTLLHEVEAFFGRTRVHRWGMRTLDIDLLACGDTVLPDAATHEAWRTLTLEQQIGRAPDGLILPHPRLQDRAFVLVPLVDVAPDWRHPLLGRTATELLAALPRADREAVQPM